MRKRLFLMLMFTCLSCKTMLNSEVITNTEKCKITILNSKAVDALIDNMVEEKIINNKGYSFFKSSVSKGVFFQCKNKDDYLIIDSLKVKIFSNEGYNLSKLDASKLDSIIDELKPIDYYHKCDFESSIHGSPCFIFIKNQAGVYSRYISYINNPLNLEKHDLSDFKFIYDLIK